MKNSGTLYIVATPIGNLEDLTRRAERVLAEVEAVAAEDTRRTRKLLTHLGIHKPLLSHYEPKEEESLPRILELLEQGKSVALVTDGGTPAVSDPGFRLVRAALAAGLTVVPVPGPSALTAALSASGLPTDRVSFLGFLPAQASAREKILLEIAGRRDTLVFFESPGRLLDTLTEALAVLGDREAALFREITKVHEEQIRGRLSEVLAKLQGRELKGEITVLIRGADKKQDEYSEADLKTLLEEALAKNDLPLSELVREIARQTGAPRKKIYALALDLKTSKK